MMAGTGRNIRTAGTAAVARRVLAYAAGLTCCFGASEPGFAAAGEPVPASSGIRQHIAAPVQPALDACSSEAADLGDYKISSEIIERFGIVSELANDFVIPGGGRVTKAIAYGGYFNWTFGDPSIAGATWRFYEDVDCAPGSLLGVYSEMGDVTFVGYDGSAFPTYKYEMCVAFDTMAGSAYWLSIQATDHPFPPQWGRQGTGGIVTGCESKFRCVAFGYPDWSDAGNVVGYPFDAAQEFECNGPCGPAGVTTEAGPRLAARLLGPTPNPSSGMVRYSIELPEGARASVRLIDVGGRIVETLLESDLPAGRHTFTARPGPAIPRGAYTLRLDVGSVHDSRMFILAD